MLAPWKKLACLFCFLVPVAYAHRQRSVALRAKTGPSDFYYPNSLTRGHPPRPPRPLSPSQSPGGEGGPSGGRFSVGWVKRALPRNPPSRTWDRLLACPLSEEKGWYLWGSPKRCYEAGDKLESPRATQGMMGSFRG